MAFYNEFLRNETVFFSVEIKVKHDHKPRSGRPLCSLNTVAMESAFAIFVAHPVVKPADTRTHSKKNLVNNLLIRFCLLVKLY